MVQKGIFYLIKMETLNAFLLQKYIVGPIQLQCDYCIAVTQVAPYIISHPVQQTHKELLWLVQHKHFPMRLQKYRHFHFCYRRGTRNMVKNTCKQCDVALCIYGCFEYYHTNFWLYIGKVKKLATLSI